MIMTVEELASVYGIKIYKTSAGEDLFTIARNIYKSYETTALMVLTTLNTLYSWDDVVPGTEIKYLNVSSTDINQLW